MGFGQGHLRLTCIAPECTNKVESSVGFENVYCKECLASIELYNSLLKVNNNKNEEDD